MKHHCWLGLILGSTLISSVASAQSSFSIKGSARVESASEEQTNAFGDNFYYGSYVGDGPCDVGICYSGQVCDGSHIASNPLGISSNSYPITHSYGCLQGACAKRNPNDGGLTGSLNVTYNFSFITPSDDQDIDIKVPITVSGSVMAIGPSWRVNVTGDGYAELVGDVAGGMLTFTSVTLHYRGTGSVQ
jgi:hypothetical protein